MAFRTKRFHAGIEAKRYSCVKTKSPDSAWGLNPGGRYGTFLDGRRFLTPTTHTVKQIGACEASSLFAPTGRPIKNSLPTQADARPAEAARSAGREPGTDKSRARAMPNREPVADARRNESSRRTTERAARAESRTSEHTRGQTWTGTGWRAVGAMERTAPVAQILLERRYG